MIELAKTNVVLASASPRRRELLQQIGVEPTIIAGDYLEQSAGQDILTVVANNTKGKLENVLKKNKLRDALVISADTVVVLDDKIFGKPQNREEAFSVLEKLSAKKHQVITGVAIYYNNEIRYDYSVTDVYMRAIEPMEIKAYIASGEPFDKAGGYGIQSKGVVFVDRIDGCYTNVVGLPLPLLCRMLRELGFEIL